MTDAPPVAAPNAPGSGRRWITAGAVAAGLFLVLELLDAFIATPLREASSAIVGTVLAALGFPVTRQGTILSTPNVRFDVVPACSGSTTLRVLLFVTVLWGGIHPRLTLPRRALMCLLALPIALLANSARVAFLVVLGHLAGEEPGGFVHTLAGILAFGAAMAASFALTDALSGQPAGRPSSDRGSAVAQGVLLAFLAAPYAYWCARAWGYALDRFGWVLLGTAAAFAGWGWRRAPADRSRDGLGTALFGVALLLLAGATVADVNIAKGVALLGIFLSLSLALKGPAFCRSMLPAAGIAYLGFPTVGYQLQAVTIPLFGAGSVATSLAFKAVLAVGLGALMFRGPFRMPAAPAAPAPGRSRWAPARLGLLSALAVLQGIYFSMGASEVIPLRLEMSYLQGEWEGRNHETPTGDKAFFDGRLWSRRYLQGARSVEVLVTSTGGDRHRAHPPAYCLTGDGWVVTAESRRESTMGGRPVPTTRMTLRRGDRPLEFAFWFTDGVETHGTYADMLATDTLRRLTGRRTDWFLFRVMTESGPPALDDFLSGFTPSLERPGAEGR